MTTFPQDFIWGTATSSYQIEGAWDQDGKGPSIWDAFCQIPGKIYGSHHGKEACDHYHRFQEDIHLMKAMGVTAYRFSLSWPRLMPQGMGQVNPAGVDFYNRVINALIDAGIQPWITLYHWDLPLALQLEDDGWLGTQLPDYFAAYANVCFREFGDRVKHWITLNEPWVVAMLGHGKGVFAPGRVSNSEPYLAAHRLLLAHAKAVNVYRETYQSHQGGTIGITNNCDWREPKTDSPADIAAAERALEFFFGWFADPIYKGDYPASMRSRVGHRLPSFTEEERTLLLGSSDFLGLNHYTTMYAEENTVHDDEESVYGNGGLSEDQDVKLSVDPTWPMTAMKWSVVPWGCTKLLHWIHDRYEGPEIIITENGCAYDDQLVDGGVEDLERIAYYEGYLNACGSAIQQGVNLKGYFAWSFMDNFEWASGYSKRFGLHYVDFGTQGRTPKASAKWLTQFIKEHSGIN